jgi:hypothetical protein
MRHMDESAIDPLTLDLLLFRGSLHAIKNNNKITDVMDVDIMKREEVELFVGTVWGIWAKVKTITNNNRRNI